MLGIPGVFSFSIYVIEFDKSSPHHHTLHTTPMLRAIERIMNFSIISLPKCIMNNRTRVIVLQGEINKNNKLCGEGVERGEITKGNTIESTAIAIRTYFYLRVGDKQTEKINVNKINKYRAAPVSGHRMVHAILTGLFYHLLIPLELGRRRYMYAKGTRSICMVNWFLTRRSPDAGACLYCPRNCAPAF